MIHVMVEDKKDGLKIVEKIMSIYFSDEERQNIEVTSLQGVWGLKGKVEEKFNSIENTDTIIVILDKVLENPIVEHEIRGLGVYIKKNGLKERIKCMYTLSFEVEVLTLIGIELFCNTIKYNEYFRNLRDIYLSSGDLRRLTETSKQDDKYSEWYEKARKSKLKRARYRQLDAEDFERSLTIETISKDIISEVFKDNDGVDKPMGECWYNGCCTKNKTECKRYFDIEYFKANPTLKLKWLIQNTSYIKLLKLLGKKDTDIKEIGIDKLLDKTVLKAFYYNKFKK